MLFSVNWNQKGIIVADQAAVRSTPNTVNYTIRKYLTAREVEQLMDHARNDDLGRLSPWLASV
jgi:hypothetical protein